MSRVLRRVGALFLAPRVDGGREEGEEEVPCVGVLCSPGDAAAVGGAIGLVLACGPVVVAVRGEVGGWVPGAPATPGARRVASRLTERGHAARATGRLVRVTLGDDAREVMRVAAAASVAIVLVVCSARDELIDEALVAQDRVVTVGEGPIADLAASSVAVLGVRARTLALPQGTAARALAAAGVAVVGPLRAAVEEALR